jgi:oxaloacetate decarboxylase alpha subunit
VRERFGSRISDEELLLRLTMPGEQVDAMLAARSSPAPAPSTRAPVVRLLDELARRPAITSFSLRAGDDTVVWRRAG